VVQVAAAEAVGLMAAAEAVVMVVTLDGMEIKAVVVVVGVHILLRTLLLQSVSE